MRLVTVLLMLATAACSTTGAMDSIISSWLGERVERVVDQWGMPNRQETMMGKNVYVWDGSTTHVSLVHGYPGPTGGTALGFSTPMSCTRMLEVNDNGIVVAGGYRGNNCCFATIAGHCRAWLNPRRR